MQELTPADAPAWYKFVSDFDASYAAFYDNYNGLMAQGPYVQTVHPEMLDYYNNLLQQGSEAAYKLEQLKATRDYVYSWLQWLSSGVDYIMDAAQGAYDYAKRQMGLGSLGIAPIIAIVGIGAATAALVEISILISKYYEAAQRFNQLQTLENQGMTPLQATTAVNSILGPPTTDNFLGIPWQLLIYGALALFLGPPIIRAFTETSRFRHGYYR